GFIAVADLSRHAERNVIGQRVGKTGRTRDTEPRLHFTEQATTSHLLKTIFLDVVGATDRAKHNNRVQNLGHTDTATNGVITTAGRQLFLDVDLVGTHNGITVQRTKEGGRHFGRHVGRWLPAPGQRCVRQSENVKTD